MTRLPASGSFVFRLSSFIFHLHWPCIHCDAMPSAGVARAQSRNHENMPRVERTSSKPCHSYCTEPRRGTAFYLMPKPVAMSAMHTYYCCGGYPNPALGMSKRLVRQRHWREGRREGGHGGAWPTSKCSAQVLLDRATTLFQPGGYLGLPAGPAQCGQARAPPKFSSLFWRNILLAFLIKSPSPHLLPNPALDRDNLN